MLTAEGNPFASDSCKLNLVFSVSSCSIACVSILFSVAATSEYGKLLGERSWSFAVKNIAPLIRPLFSTWVMSAKYDKHEGIPKPNEAPRKKLIVK